MPFAKKLKDLREKKNLSQEELAKLCQVSTKTISRYELGQSKPRYRKTYDLLAKHLSTSHDYLVTDDEEYVRGSITSKDMADATNAQDMVEGVIGLMAGGSIDEKDKRVILDAITEAFYLSKKSEGK